MKEVIRRHVQDELMCLSENSASVQEMGELIESGVYIPTREYISILKRVVKIQEAISSCNSDIKQIYVYRYKQNMSWVAVAFALGVSDSTAKRYNRRLIEKVAKQLGWI